MMNLNINKFSFAQMTSNSDGKTSASGTTGIFIVGVGLLCFMVGVVDYMTNMHTAEVMMYSVGIIGTGTGLLGYRKSHDSKIVPVQDVPVKDPIPPPPKPDVLNEGDDLST